MMHPLICHAPQGVVGTREGQSHQGGIGKQRVLRYLFLTHVVATIPPPLSPSPLGGASGQSTPSAGWARTASASPAVAAPSTACPTTWCAPEPQSHRSRTNPGFSKGHTMSYLDLLGDGVHPSSCLGVHQPPFFPAIGSLHR